MLTKTAIHKYKQLFGFIRAKINLKKKKTQRKKWQIGHKMQTKPIHFLVLNLKKNVHLEYLILQHSLDEVLIIDFKIYLMLFIKSLVYSFYN